MKTNPVRFDYRLSLAFLASAVLALICSTVPPVQAASWEGTDDFSSGISVVSWTLYQANTGQMTVTGANGHASYLVPSFTTDSQNAYIVWHGKPTAAEDWVVEITGRNSASYSAQGSSQLQIAVSSTASIGTSHLEGYRISMARGSAGQRFNAKQWINGLDITRATVTAPNALFAMRLVYHSATGTIEAWYDPDGAGVGWTKLDSISLAEFSPSMTASSTFTFGILGNAYYGPITEGELLADNFSLSGLLPPNPIVTTGTATPNSPTSAILTGSVNPNGFATTARFDYGLTTAYGSMLSVPLSPSNGSAPQTVSATINGLQPGTVYHFRLTATNNGGSGNGGDATFVAGAIPFTYATNNGTITITGYTGSGGDVNIPSMINYLPVSTIGDTAFFGNAILDNVTIPNSVTSIGPLAFYNCTNLTSVSIPDSVTSIGNSAFSDCASLARVNIPTSVTNIGVSVFAMCTSLTHVTIPNSVVFLGSDAFAYCSSLTNVAVGSGITSIGGETFMGCSGLTTITIPNGVTNIGYKAFAGSGLTSVTIGSGVTRIEDLAFAGCTSLTIATIGNSVTVLGESAFSDCPSLTSVTVGDSVATIGEYAFFGCTSLTSITLPNSVTSLARGAFSGCWSLTGVYFQGNAPIVGSNVFNDCDNATIYYLLGTTGWGSTLGGRPAMMWNPLLPYNYTTNIGTIAIVRYTGPGGAVTIPSAINGMPVTTISDSAFVNCFGLASVSIPDSVATIGNSAFLMCYSLARVSIPDSVTSIGNSAFSECFSLASVTIPDSVVSLGDAAFAYCSSLASVTIGNGIADIGNNTFQDCTSLTGVYCWGDAPWIGSDVFSGTDSTTVYYLPGTTGWGPTFADRPTAFWVLPFPVILGKNSYFGVQTNAFGFLISWATNVPVIVDASTTITSPIWSPVSTNTLLNGTSHFTDPNWTNYPARFYRVRSR